MQERQTNLVMIGWKPVSHYLGAIMERFKKFDQVQMKFSNAAASMDESGREAFYKNLKEIIVKTKKLKPEQKDFVQLWIDDMSYGMKMSARDKAYKIIQDLAHLGVCCHSNVIRTTEKYKGNDRYYITVTLYKYGTLKVILPNIIEGNKEAVQKL